GSNPAGPILSRQTPNGAADQRPRSRRSSSRDRKRDRSEGGPPARRACSPEKPADDEPRNAARELLREVRAGDGHAWKGAAREAARPTSRTVRDRVLLRKPERARDLVFADRARLRGAVLDRAAPGQGEPVFHAGRP